MTDTETILFANDVFYRAFDDQDPKSMDRLWSQKFSVCCVHPGWGPIYVRKEIIKSWVAIMTNPEAPKIRCLDAKAEIYGDMAVILTISLDTLEVRHYSWWWIVVKSGGLWSVRGNWLIL